MTKHHWRGIDRLFAIVAAALAVLGLYFVVALVLELLSPTSSAGHHDFFAFYSATTLLSHGQASSMYDAGALTAVQRSILPTGVGYAGYMPFLNPPFAAVPHLPLAALSEPAARMVWTGVDAVIALGCVYLVTLGLSKRVRLAAAVGILLSFASYQALVEAQWSFVLLLSSLLALHFMRRGQRELAGVTLAGLALKPPLLVLVLIGLLITRQARTALVTLGTTVLLAVIALPWTGVQVYGTYARFLIDVSLSHVSGAGATGQTTWEGTVSGMQGLNGLVTSMLGQDHPVAVDIIAGVVASTLVVGFLMTVRPWRHKALSTAEVLGMMALGLLLDPHLYAQDCVLLVVPLTIALRAATSDANQVRLLLGAVVLIDCVGIDTSWSPHPLAWPPHLLTWALLAGVTWTITKGHTARIPHLPPSPRRLAA